MYTLFRNPLRKRGVPSSSLAITQKLCRCYYIRVYIYIYQKRGGGCQRHWACFYLFVSILFSELYTHYIILVCLCVLVALGKRKELEEPAERAGPTNSFQLSTGGYCRRLPVLFNPLFVFKWIVIKKKRRRKRDTYSYRKSLRNRRVTIIFDLDSDIFGLSFWSFLVDERNWFRFLSGDSNARSSQNKSELISIHRVTS